MVIIKMADKTNLSTESSSNFAMTGVNPDLKITVWNILSGVLVALIIFFVLTRKSKPRRISKKSKSLLKLILIIVFFAGVVGVGSYFLLLPYKNQDKLVAISDKLFGQTFPVVKFPLTGTDPVPQVLLQSVKSLYTTPIDGLITLFLLISIFFLTVAAFRNIIFRRKIEKDLENAKIAAQNVYEDLQVEAETLAEAKAKEEAILSSIADGFIALDKSGKVIFMNKTAEKMLGYTSTESMGKLWHEILHREDEKGNPLLPMEGAIQEALSRAATTTTTITTSIYYLRKDGTKFPVSRTVSPIVLGGKVIGAINIFRDITREKEIDRAKTEFVSLASHQLRTPTTAVKWYSEMLRDEEVGVLNEKQKEYLKEINHGNQRMIDLVNTLLSVSRIELGTFAVQPGPVNIASIADDVLKELQSQINEKRLEVSREYENDIPNIESDQKLIRIVFQNLLSNSVEYTAPDGKISVRIKKNNQGVHIEVYDNGLGIPESAQSKIYTKFFRADNAHTVKPDGTGLGLYITKSIVEALGGTISFESKEGEGTNFSVDLPSRDTVEKEINGEIE